MRDKNLRISLETFLNRYESKQNCEEQIHIHFHNHSRPEGFHWLTSRKSGDSDVGDIVMLLIDEYVKIWSMFLTKMAETVTNVL